MTNRIDPENDISDQDVQKGKEDSTPLLRDCVISNTSEIFCFQVQRRRVNRLVCFRIFEYQPLVIQPNDKNPSKRKVKKDRQKIRFSWL